MQSERFDVVVVGELNPDLILSGDVIPEFDQVEKLVDQATLTIGSSSAIFACGAARLGLRTAFIGKVGKDLFGKFMCRSLENYGIDTSGVVTDEIIPTGISVILSKGNDRAILTYPGTIHAMEFAEIKKDIIFQARHLHVASYFIQEVLRPDLPRLFNEAHRAGLSTSLDTNYDPSGKWDLGIWEVLGQTDLFLPNAVECQQISRIPNLELAIKTLEKKVGYLGVKLGSEGAILCHASGKYRMKSLDVNVVDTVGAGDSFDAGFVYGYLAGWEPEKILRTAVVCGSLSTRQAGGTAGQPNINEVMKYLEDQGNLQ
jgi:sugar/nucleoside kinase (ribokinase family)